MGKGAFIKKMDGYSQKLQYKHYNGKKQTEGDGEGRRVKDMKFSEVK